MIGLDILEGIGWRDVILLLAAIVGVYLVLAVMRLFQIRGKRGDDSPRESKRRFSGWEPYTPHQAPTEPAATATPAPVFAHELARSNAEVELQSLRHECAQLREEIAYLADEMTRLKATRNVSPLYNEAMVLAQQGMPATGIAGHCGISIGEAELVAALARGDQGLERHEQGQGEERNGSDIDPGNRHHG